MDWIDLCFHVLDGFVTDKAHRKPVVLRGCYESFLLFPQKSFYGVEY